MSSSPSSGAAASPARATVVGVVAAATAAQVACVMGAAIFPVIALPLAAELDADPALIGYQMSIIYAAATFGAPWLSVMVARWGACRGTQVGLAFAVAGALCALVPAVPALILASILIGFSITTMTPTSVHLLMRYTPVEHRSLLFSLKQTGVPLAWAVMAAVAPAIAQTLGWRWAVAIVILSAGLLALALQPVRAQWDDDRHEQAANGSGALEGLRVMWRHPTLRRMAVATFCLSFVQLCLGTFAVTTLVKEAGYSLVAAGFLLSVTQLAGVTGRILWGWVADRTGASLRLVRNLAIVSMVCCPLMTLIDAATPPALVTVYFFVFGITAVGWNGVFLAEIARRSPPGLAGVTSGGASVWTYGGILVGPAVFASLCRALGSYGETFVLLGLVGIAATVSLMMAMASAQRDGADAC